MAKIKKRELHEFMIEQVANGWILIDIIHGYTKEVFSSLDDLIDRLEDLVDG